MFQKDYWERSDLARRRSPAHPVVAEYAKPKIAAILRHVPIDQNTTLLDVGCGNGYFSYHLSKLCHVTGVDFSEKMLAMNPIRHKAVMDANSLRFADESFDVVFCHALLHHVDDMQRVIGEMKRVSKKFVVILEPNRDNPAMFLFSALVPEERKALRFSLGYLERQVKMSGLHLLASFSSGVIVPNKTPRWALPVMRRIEFKNHFGMTHTLIAAKT